MGGFSFSKGKIALYIHDSAFYEPKEFEATIITFHTFPFWPNFPLRIAKKKVKIKCRGVYHGRQIDEYGGYEYADWRQRENKVFIRCSKKLKRAKPHDPHKFTKCQTLEDLRDTLERFFAESKDPNAKFWYDIVKNRKKSHGLDSCALAMQSLL